MTARSAPERWLCVEGCCSYEPPGGKPGALSYALGYHRPPANPLCPFCLATMVRETHETLAAYRKRRHERGFE